MIYISELIGNAVSKKWPYTHHAYLMADTVDELHAFAKRLGLKRAWFQPSNGRFPHYDVTRNKRKCAIELGAKQDNVFNMVRRAKR